MSSWSSQLASPSVSPAIKFEVDPADGLMAAPSGMFPSIFDDSVDPVDMMTPQSFHDSPDCDAPASSPYERSSEAPFKDPSSASDKKQTKKRKSWGQVLPEPKTNLPPRKRAKTEDEKEQRRVERVLRNRKAAQSSRERKRQEVEALESRNKELENRLEQLQQILHDVMHGAGSQQHPGVDQAFRSASSPTLTPDLFGSQDNRDPVYRSTKSQTYDDIMDSLQPNKTVNPASLSPAMSPAAEEDYFDDEAELAPAATPAAKANEAAHVSTDPTQHPAEMLCSDLPCRSVETAQPQITSQATLQMQFFFAGLLLMTTTALYSMCSHPLTTLLLSMTGSTSPLPPSRPILMTILWLVTSTPRNSSTSTAQHSITLSRQPTPPQSTAHPSLRSTALRLRTLRKILSCSPALARPLLDATAEVLRLVTKEGREFDRVADDAKTMGKSLTSALESRDRQFNKAELPSKERLLTLMWVLKVEERKIQIRARKEMSSSSKRLGRTSVPEKLPTAAARNNKNFALSVNLRRKPEQGKRSGVGGTRRWTVG